MIRPRELLAATRAQLRELLVSGHPVAAEALCDTEYRGTSLGLPAIVDLLTWKTFRKTFYRDPALGLVRGWNVRLVQRGLEGPSEPLLRGGVPVTFGHYVVRDPRCVRAPARCNRGLVLDYSAGHNGRMNPISLVRDPIVALQAGSADLLFGWTYLQLGRWQAGTPSYFILEREGPLTFIAKPH